MVVRAVHAPENAQKKVTGKEKKKEESKTVESKSKQMRKIVYTQINFIHISLSYIFIQKKKT